jgi:hypothetical protein
MFNQILKTMKKTCLLLVLCLLFSVQAYCQPPSSSCDTLPGSGLSACSGVGITIIPSCPPSSGTHFVAVVFTTTGQSLTFTDYEFFLDCEEAHGQSTRRATSIDQFFHNVSPGTYQVTFIGTLPGGSQCRLTTTVTTPLTCPSSTSRTSSVNFIEDHTAEISLAPNPTNSSVSFIVDGINGLNYTVCVRDSKGKTMDIFENLSSGVKLEIGGNYTSGIYFIETISSNGVKRNKFVKL